MMTPLFNIRTFNNITTTCSIRGFKNYEQFNECSLSVVKAKDDIFIIVCYVQYVLNV